MASVTDITFWIAFSAGVLSFFSPCVLPLLPSYLGYITGISFARLEEPRPGNGIQLTVLWHCLSFVAGFSLVFILLGAMAGAASGSLHGQLRDALVWVQRLGGVLIFLFGVHLAGFFHFGILLGERRIHLNKKPAGLTGTFLVGLAFAAGWTPCIGPILGAILALAATAAGGVRQGIFLLSAYSLGLGLPFLISGLLLPRFLSAFNRFRKHILLIKLATGLLLMVAGVMLFFDLFGFITAYLFALYPAFH